MRVLLTRPEEDAIAFASRLKDMGHDPVVAPLLRVRFHAGPEIVLAGVQAVLATSANGIRALARRTRRRDVPVFAVGPQTGAQALAEGFADVRNADGDARALLAATLSWARPRGGTLLHVRGAESSRELETLLCHEGFDVRGAEIYDVAAEPALPEWVARQIREGLIGAALFFSPRSARIFRGIATEESLGAGTMIAVCISRATADALAPLRFREVRIAEKPNQDSMLACLGTAA
ncbi:MAG TPA: uroporphyrinogen-III synthase [Rhizomicrobium sp.]|jgi:uroporphyrinogen-III synthase|nr:uroporphyrinogen-III synthase [Rhizomicrobium sp.]